MTTNVIKTLFDKYKRIMPQAASHDSSYTETEARVEFIDPLFNHMGWDMANNRGLSNSEKEVVREESQPTETTNKRPDYTFRHNGVRKFFVEAKKPAVDIRTHKESAFQARSYGYTAGHSISVLTNFRSLRIYDAKVEPRSTDDANVALLVDIQWDELPDRFIELERILGKSHVESGSIERTYGQSSTSSIRLNESFLQKFNEWRLQIARDLHGRYADLTISDLDDTAQKVINRLILIRMCEDRGIEGEGVLRKCANEKSIVKIRQLFAKLDERYNTGLFDVDNDRLQKDYSIDCELINEIVEQLYFPSSPYNYSVLDADFIGQVYELFLVKKLALTAGGAVELVDKPDYVNREVVVTPQPIVDELVKIVFQKKLSLIPPGEGSRFDKLKAIKCLDIAIGSGRFLLKFFELLCDELALTAIREGRTECVTERSTGAFHLRFEQKKQVATNCLFGIDVDYNAVEVARFSLIIKLLEEERSDSLPAGRKVLPNLDSNIVWGNSIVSTDFDARNEDVLIRTQPLDWSVKLPPSFDVIIGNPPYMKTEEMKEKNPEEHSYIKKRYATAHKQFDKYFAFIERSIGKLSDSGITGLVVPNKWMTNESGKKLRGMISQNLCCLVNFGTELVFEGKSTYVCILVVSKTPSQSFEYNQPQNYQLWAEGHRSSSMMIDSNLIKEFGSDTWVLPADTAEKQIIDHLCEEAVRLDTIVDIKNGIQTSAESIFSIDEHQAEGNVIVFKKNGRAHRIESALTRPYLKDSANSIRSYLNVSCTSLLIFPYTIDQQGHASIIPPDVLSRDYPLTYSYLKAHEDTLNKRDIQPTPNPGVFYAYGRHQSLESAFQSPKLIYSVNQIGDKYGFDGTGIGFASGGTAGEVAIINPRDGYTLELILAILNQPEIEFLLRKRGSPFRGGYYSRGTAVMAGLLIPRVDLSIARNANLVVIITGHVRDRIALEGQRLSATGRQLETLKTRIAVLDDQITNLIHSLWNVEPMVFEAAGGLIGRQN